MFRVFEDMVLRLLRSVRNIQYNLLEKAAFLRGKSMKYEVNRSCGFTWPVSKRTAFYTGFPLFFRFFIG